MESPRRLQLRPRRRRHLAADGFAVDAALLIAMLASGGIRVGARLYFSLLLVLEASMLGVFMARDWSLFYVFWEFTLIRCFS